MSHNLGDERPLDPWPHGAPTIPLIAGTIAMRAAGCIRLTTEKSHWFVELDS